MLSIFGRFAGGAMSILGKFEDCTTGGGVFAAGFAGSAGAAGAGDFRLLLAAPVAGANGAVVVGGTGFGSTFTVLGFSGGIGTSSSNASSAGALPDGGLSSGEFEMTDDVGVPVTGIS